VRALSEAEEHVNSTAHRKPNNTNVNAAYRIILTNGGR